MPLRLLPRTHTLRWRPQLPHGQSPHPGTRLCGSIGVVQPVTTGHDRPRPRMESHAAAIVHRILEAPMPQPRRVTKTTNIVPGLRVEERGQNSPESNAQGNVARHQTSVPTPDGVPPAQSLTPSLSLSLLTFSFGLSCKQGRRLPCPAPLYSTRKAYVTRNTGCEVVGICGIS
jgi:hypothetical protein